jgi:AmmeMemoRadiSam system protein B
MDRRGRLKMKRRASVVNDIFYPENREALTEKLLSWGLIEGSSDSRSGGHVILAPHGAWDITGNIAASAFSAVQSKRENSSRPINRVLLLGTCHHSVEEGIYLSESASFETPLGDIEVDQKLNRELVSCSTTIRVNDIPHLSEHSLEVLLPMVKYCFPQAKILPILTGNGDRTLVNGLGGVLRFALKNDIEESLVVISSSVSQNSDPALARTMAEEFCSLLEDMDTETYMARLASGNISACGGALVGALLETGLFDGENFSSVCPFSHSPGENSETVYYGAFIL